eukprot:TRINITY_DN25430_c0_g1_i1.p1 TRINITY_DN25430_c0_g1~~TRINITY_DN25430_c0_g1_i1.p1  ORF type:complete len:275 (-),score=97.07 TRINITY_DN25430_c0_g1_i1:104-928(-)
MSFESSTKQSLLQSESSNGAASSGLPVVDAALIDDSQKVQQTVQRIQQQISAIQREADKLEVSSDTQLPDRKAIQEVFRAGQEAVEEGRRLLESWSTTSSSGTDKKMSGVLRLKREKLGQNLSSAASALEAAWKKYLAAHEKKKASLAEYVASQGTTTATVSSSSSSSQAPASLQLQQQVQDDVLQAEAETHAAVAAEFTDQVLNITSDVRSLQGEALDDIEANMERGADNTQDATEQLTIASERQKRAIKSVCNLLIAASVIAIFALAMVSKE